MAHHGSHAKGFLDLVNDAKSRIKEMTVAEFKQRIDAGENWILIDVREDHEWAAGRLPNAVHLSKGILERDIERHFPDRDSPLVLQCGDGYRSAISAENLEKMGYTNVYSLDGGYKGWIQLGLPIEQGDA